MVAQSLAYFFRHVLDKPFQTPGKIYPKRAFILPSVLTRAEVGQLLSSCRTLKERAILELFYSSGLRLNRFSNHILPPYFVRVRHYGLLTNRNRKTRLNAVMENMDLESHPEKLEVSAEILRLLTFGSSERSCPFCKIGKLTLVGIVYPMARGDPTLHSPRTNSGN